MTINKINEEVENSLGASLDIPLWNLVEDEVFVAVVDNVEDKVKDSVWIYMEFLITDFIRNYKFKN